jgi:hypothetical protein
MYALSMGKTMTCSSASDLQSSRSFRRSEDKPLNRWESQE